MKAIESTIQDIIKLHANFGQKKDCGVKYEVSTVEGINIFCENKFSQMIFLITVDTWSNAYGYVILTFASSKFICEPVNNN